MQSQFIQINGKDSQGPQVHNVRVSSIDFVRKDSDGKVYICAGGHLIATTEVYEDLLNVISSIQELAHQ